MQRGASPTEARRLPSTCTALSCCQGSRTLRETLYPPAQGKESTVKGGNDQGGRWTQKEPQKDKAVRVES